MPSIWSLFAAPPEIRLDPERDAVIIHQSVARGANSSRCFSTAWRNIADAGSGAVIVVTSSSCFRGLDFPDLAVRVGHAAGEGSNFGPSLGVTGARSQARLGADRQANRTPGRGWIHCSASFR